MAIQISQTKLSRLLQSSFPNVASILFFFFASLYLSFVFQDTGWHYRLSDLENLYFLQHLEKWELEQPKRVRV